MGLGTQKDEPTKLALIDFVHKVYLNALEGGKLAIVSCFIYLLKDLLLTFQSIPV